MATKRDSRFELLRIISMIMIVSFHAFSQIGYYDLNTKTYSMIKSTAGFSINILGLSILGSWGLTGVGCFFLMSALFLQKKNGYKTIKAVKIIIQTIFWALIMVSISVILDTLPVNISFGLKILIKTFLSPFIDEYWYISAYLFMYLLSPFMNKIIDNLNLAIYKRLMVILTLIIPVYSTFVNKSITICNLILPIYYYLLWGLLKQIKGNVFEKYAKLIFVGTTFSVVLGMSAGYILGMQTALVGRVCGRYSGLQMLNALSLFYIFKNLKLPNIKLINLIASGTLGVYLIHENVYFRFYLWNNIFNLFDKVEENFFLLYFIFCVLIVFVVAICLDLIRQFIIEKPLSKALKHFEKYFTKIDSYVNGSDIVKTQ